MKFVPHEYQAFAAEHIIKNPYAGLFLDMGLGKTVTTLTAVNELIYDYFEVTKVLVIAPLRVAEYTWAAEVEKWDHLNHLRISKVLGPESTRKEALKVDADIYVINRENVAWLVGLYGRGFPFDMVVIDELSSFKSAKSQRFKMLKQIRPYLNRVVGLTGTPAPNSLIDLWPQLYLLDMGERLGKTITGYRQKYFTPGATNGQIVFNYKLNADGENEIHNRISDICVSMKAKDYLDLPERIDRHVMIELPEKIKRDYEDFEKKSILELIDGEINVANAAALSNKLLQFANGAVYDEDRNIKEIHREKIKELEEILDTANGRPVLVFYTYQHDMVQIRKYLKAYNPKKLETTDDIEEWNKGKIPLLLAHPASAGHGLNLQAGGNIIVWFGLTWSLELYEQANARLHRQGQTQAVIIHHLIAKGTMDESVIRALTRKADCQNALMDAVKARIRKVREEMRL